ncbi:hypothetical protein [Enterobacter asburiae]|uniref:hypothetical protein n=1 Tax=Enterobacter asburiae TaxID=61645 RepID=UPI001F310D2D|nr:hypothetical protein [Enterobacter asburiae]
MSIITKEQLIEDLKASTQNSSGMFEIGEETICALMSLLSTPPAPVSVPDELSREEYKRRFMEEENFDDTFRGGWNACRAAMLQGADGALTNEDTKRVGELVMLVKRLAHSLRKANPDSKLQSDAMDYLSRKGLIGVEDILR